jgi:hypothetical protein
VAPPLAGTPSLLALQRSAGNRNVVRALAPKSLARQPTQAPPRAPARRRRSAPAAPHLELRPSVNGPPCACLVFMHNNERNARLTAELLHRHCSFNLVIVAPDTGARRISLPSGRGTVDPNELFPPEVIEQCLDDPGPCEDFIAAHRGSTDPDVIRRTAERQFFLAIREGSDGFRLPVVALHNNAVDDTARYRQAAPNTTAIRGGTFGQPPPGSQGGAVRPLQELRDWLSNLDQATLRALTERRGTTNIFRWCLSPDITRCHIGDPDRPDAVVWVTNDADFNRLSAQPINVVLQQGAAASGESATDLSTLFLTARELINARADEELGRLALPAGDDIWTTLERWGVRLRRGIVEAVRSERLSHLRYINIETPGSPTSAGQTAAQLREDSFNVILTALRAAGLDCCNSAAGVGEAAVRAGLRRGTLDAPP